MTKVLANEATRSASELTEGDAQAPSTGALLLNSVPKLGVWAWTFVGLVLVLIIVCLLYTSPSPRD